MEDNGSNQNGSNLGEQPLKQDYLESYDPGRPSEYDVVSDQIRLAQDAEDSGDTAAAKAAWQKVSLTEEVIAGLTGLDEAEINIAKRGAVNAAIKSGELERAKELQKKYNYG